MDNIYQRLVNSGYEIRFHANAPHPTPSAEWSAWITQKHSYRESVVIDVHGQGDTPGEALADAFEKLALFCEYVAGAMEGEVGKPSFALPPFYTA